MKRFSIKTRERREGRNKRNLIRAAFIFIFFVLINLLFNTVLDPPQTVLPIIFGIFVPLVYSIVYFISKKIRYSRKIKIKPYFLTPIFYLAIGLAWFLVVIGFSGISSVEFNSPVKARKRAKAPAQTEAPAIVIPKKNDIIIQSPFDPENIKSIFLYNDYLCKVAGIPELIIKIKCKKDRTLTRNTCEGFSKTAINYTSTFFILLICQMIVIFTAEKFLYPRKKKIKHTKSPENEENN